MTNPSNRRRTVIQETILTANSSNTQTPSVPTTSLESSALTASPKLSGKSKRSAYRYYAAFSEDFVREILTRSHLGPDDVVLDPWNGSGTTTRIAAQLGLRAWGIDLNPVMTVLARARLIDSQEAQDAGRFLAELVDTRPQSKSWTRDPLRIWFEPRSASLIRGAIHNLHDHSCASTHAVDPRSLSTRQAYLVTVVFTAVRELLARFVASNPTWVRLPKLDDDRIKVDWKAFRSKLIESAMFLQATAFPTPVSRSRIRLLTGSSDSLPADMPDFSLVLTSPPYCTRIDYAVATRPELAVLGLPTDEQASLRRSLLGATTVPDEVPLDSGRLGPAAMKLLEEVGHHPAKASATYYFKWLAQYLGGYADSLKQLSDRANEEGRMVFVVQDSFYKDIHIDLAKITTDILGMYNWELANTHGFHLPVTMAGVNPGSRKYRTDFSATEQVLIFKSASR